MRIAVVLVAVVWAAGAGGCAAVEALGDRAGRGLSRGVEAGKLTGDAVKGARAELATPETRATISALGGSAVDGLRAALADQKTSLAVQALEDRLFDRLDTRLGQTVDGVLVPRLARAREQLLGAGLRQDLVALRDQVLDQGLEARVDALRGRLLGAPLRDELGLLVDRLATEFDQKIKPRLREETGALGQRFRDEQKALETRVRRILYVAGGVVAALLVLAAVLFARYRRSSQLTRLLTSAIDALRDVDAGGHERIKNLVSRRAKDAGLEPSLRVVLEQQGILRPPDPPPVRVAQAG